MRIPCHSQSASAEPLKRVLVRASKRLDLSRYDVSNVAAVFLEEIMEEVASGHVVSIPGFGALGPWLIETRSALARDPSWRCKPVFSPARTFAVQVRNSAPANRNGKRKLSRHRRNHLPSAKEPRRVDLAVTTAEAIRASIRAQLAECRSGDR